MDVNLRSLIGKFNQTTRNATEAAAGLCLTRTHYNVEVEHYLSKLLESTDGDFAAIAKHYGIDKARFSGELTRALDRFKTGNGRTPTLSPDFVETMTNAWTIASIDFGVAQIRTGFTVLALTSDDKLSRIMREISKEFPRSRLRICARTSSRKWNAARAMWTISLRTRCCRSCRC